MKHFYTIKTLTLMLLLGSAMMFVSCDEDDITEIIPDDIDLGLEPTVDIDNPDQVAAGVQVTGSTSEAGNPPASTSTAGTPLITNDKIETKTSQEGTATINLNISSTTTVNGFYFQIEGASSYLDIPFTAAGRTLEETATFDLGLAGVFAPGEFCGEVCAYNADDQVSAPVLICITVVELGGEGSGFLVGSWKLVSEVEGDGTVYNVGENYEEEGYYYNCNQEEILYTRIERTDFINVDVNTLGEIIVEGQEFSYELNQDTYNCENVPEEMTETFKWQGVWSYDDVNKVLDMILTDETGDEEVESFTVVQTNGGFELHFIGDNDYLVFAAR